MHAGSEERRSHHRRAWIKTAIIHTLLILLSGDVQLIPGPSEALQGTLSLSCVEVRRGVIDNAGPASPEVYSAGTR